MDPHEKTHYVYGIVPLQKRNDVWYVFVIHRVKGFWEFPKGHSNEGEEQVETAKRELFEETGLHVKRLLSPVPIPMHYSFMHGDCEIQKFAIYYVAEVEGEIHLQEEEVQDGSWIPLSKANTLLTYDNSKVLCDGVKALLGV